MKKFEKVTFAREIAKIMNNLHEAKARLVIRFAQGEDSYRSSIVGMDEDTSTLGLSNFLSKTGQSEMPPGQSLTVATVVGGMECLFETSIVYKSVTHGAHEIAFPKVLQYLQRRKSYRVETAGTGLTVLCQMTRGALITGEAIDLSATGLRFTLDEGESAALDIGDVVEKCQLDLSNGVQVTFKATVRFKAENNKKQMIIGIEIDEIHNSDQARIERYVSLRDLELRRQASDARE
ncbi:MAG: flagellar brake protein [Gammaproteobacteria bacterium]|nr:flagellar brake protein [Gammaproteobacteria bacterium]